MKFESLKKVEKQLERDYMKKWQSVDWCEVTITPIVPLKTYMVAFLLYDRNYGLQKLHYNVDSKLSFEKLYNNISHEIELG